MDWIATEVFSGGEEHKGEFWVATGVLGAGECAMNKQLDSDEVPREPLAYIVEHVRCRLLGRVRDFQVVFRDDGLVLRGHVHTYYTKQLVQHAVQEMTDLPIQANEVEVC